MSTRKFTDIAIRNMKPGAPLGARCPIPGRTQLIFDYSSRAARKKLRGPDTASTARPVQVHRLPPRPCRSPRPAREAARHDGEGGEKASIPAGERETEKAKKARKQRRTRSTAVAKMYMQLRGQQACAARGRIASPSSTVSSCPGLGNTRRWRRSSGEGRDQGPGTGWRVEETGRGWADHGRSRCCGRFSTGMRSGPADFRSSLSCAACRGVKPSERAARTRMLSDEENSGSSGTRAGTNRLHVLRAPAFPFPTLDRRGAAVPRRRG